MKTFPVVVLLSCFACNAVAAIVPVEVPHARTTDNRTRKPSLPVTIATTLPAKIVAGQSLTLDVAVTSSLQQGQLVITFVPDDGLALISPQQEQQFTLTDAGLFKTNIALTVVPPQDGSYAVTVDIRHVVDGRVRGVARGITFRVGDEPVAAAIATKSRAVTSGDDADNVISLPAQETIIRQ